MAGRDAGTSTGAPGYQGAGTQRGTEYREPREPVSYEELTGISPARAGGILLASVLMIFSGLVTFFFGIAQLIHGSYFRVVGNYVFTVGSTGRGIVELILGALIFGAGVCLVLGMLWARIVGVVLAVLSGIANFMFLPWSPVWSVIVLALDVFIIWALVGGGGRRERRLA
jgi:hypothetical protein